MIAEDVRNALDCSACILGIYIKSSQSNIEVL
jgi:hypothetical protein